MGKISQTFLKGFEVPVGLNVAGEECKCERWEGERGVEKEERQQNEFLGQRESWGKGLTAGAFSLLHRGAILYPVIQENGRVGLLFFQDNCKKVRRGIEKNKSMMLDDMLSTTAHLRLPCF